MPRWPAAATRIDPRGHAPGRRALSWRFRYDRKVPHLRSDADLLKRFRAGERAALETVYWAYVAGVEAILRHGVQLPDRGTFLRGLDWADVADLVQETFLRAFAEDTRLRYDGLRDYAPYLAAIARNLLVDRARARKRHREALVPEIEVQAAADPPPTSDEDDEERSWLDDDATRVVKAYLKTLDPPLRALHRERYLKGRSQRETAAKLGLSRQAVRTMEAKLRDGLRKFIVLNRAKSGK
jgi:RNA polymerase sigma factor (sigma-70 family)